MALKKSEDWWTVWLGLILFGVSLLGIITTVPKPNRWVTNPFNSFSADGFISYLLLTIILLILLSISIKSIQDRLSTFIPAFLVFSILGLVAQVISKQSFMGTYGLEYVLWALIIGLIISNTIGVPDFLKPAIKTELYIKIGLVLLGAEILFSRMLNLGIPGLLLAWGVTPLVLFLMYKFGTSVLKLDKTLTVLMSAATSVCGVSAAIAVAAATKAKKEFLTLTISISLLSTVILLVGLPALVRLAGIDYIIGGAWIGGTVDSTGAVVAAGELLGEEAMEVATVIKLIQNVMIALIAFVIAFLWVTKIDRTSNDKPGLIQIWYRFPKFIIGFAFLSILSSFVVLPIMGEMMLTDILKLTGSIRTFLFAVAFLSIGLETDFKTLKTQISGGKPVQLYIVGQSLNLILTLIFAWMLFGSW
ncbi:MAG: putative sulfate exporter family transporter [Candidatus Bathyarchaeota archaeon]|nr:putative sulfate exporter family transporter [Candidatus Bathyarchaeota archaeon]